MGPLVLHRRNEILLFLSNWMEENEKKNEMNKNVHFGFGISVGSKTTENGQ